MSKTESKIPAGYKRIESGSFPPNHDFKKKPILAGTVQAIKSVPQKRGKKTEEVTVIYVADDKTGEVSAVWESHSLAELMRQVKVGNKVYIEFEGVSNLKGKKTLKNFVTAIGASK